MASDTRMPSPERVMETALRALLVYDPPQVIKDDFAYDRLLGAVHQCAEETLAEVARLRAKTKPERRHRFSLHCDYCGLAHSSFEGNSWDAPCPESKLEDAPKVYACGCTEAQPCRDHARPCTCARMPHTTEGVRTDAPCPRHGEPAE